MNVSLDHGTVVTPAKAKKILRHLADYASYAPDANESDWDVYNIVKAYAEGKLVPKEAT